MPNLTIIVATDILSGIGKNNTLPWNIPEDLAHFKKTTLDHPIIMGRRTFDSIGRPLPKRRNIVITRNKEWTHEGVEVVHSLEEAIALVGDVESFVIGGAEIYAQAIKHSKKIIRTQILKDYNCDVKFPPLSMEWVHVFTEQLDTTLDHGVYILTYIKE